MNKKVIVVLITSILILIIVVFAGVKDVLKTSAVNINKTDTLTKSETRLKLDKKDVIHSSAGTQIKAKAKLSSYQSYFPQSNEKRGKIDPHALNQVQNAADNSLDPQRLSAGRPDSFTGESTRMRDVRLPEGIDTIDTGIYLDADGNVVIPDESDYVRR